MSDSATSLAHSRESDEPQSARCGPGDASWLVSSLERDEEAAAPAFSECSASKARAGLRAAVQVALRVGEAAHLRRALAVLAGELVRRRGWEPLGFARMRDYATERAGVSTRQLQELSRVDRALAELPIIDAALTSGELSWTQVRLLCRVATTQSQAKWLARALGATHRCCRGR